MLHDHQRHSTSSTWHQTWWQMVWKLWERLLMAEKQSDIQLVSLVITETCETWLTHAMFHLMKRHPVFPMAFHPMTHWMVAMSCTVYSRYQWLAMGKLHNSPDRHLQQTCRQAPSLASVGFSIPHAPSLVQTLTFLRVLNIFGSFAIHPSSCVCT
jgi:hypothetical protein